MWGRLVAVVLFVTILGSSFSQFSANSPYSRFAFGDIQNKGTGFTSSMAGTGTAIISRDFINFQNPAVVYGNHQTLFDVGISATGRNLESNIGTSSSGDGAIDYFAMTISGQGTSRKWYGGRYAMGIGLLPYSIMSYNTTSEVEITGGDNEFITLSDRGSGVINKALLVNSFKLVDQQRVNKKNTDLSIGIESSYIFGLINQSVDAQFESDNFYHSAAYENHYRGLLLKPGIFMSQVVKTYTDSSVILKGENAKYPVFPTHKVNFGFTSTSASNLQAEQDQSSGYYSSTGLPLDTSTTTVVDGASASLHSEIRFGLAYQKIVPFRPMRTRIPVVKIDSLGDTTIVYKEKVNTSSWVLGVDMWMTDWSSYKNPFDSESYSNTFGVSIGGQYSIDVKGIGDKTQYWRGIIYRAGVSYETLPYTINGETISEVGINVGFGLPLSKNRLAGPKYINLNLGYAQRGTTQSNLVAESIFKAQISFNLSSSDWFIQKREGL